MTQNTEIRQPNWINVALILLNILAVFLLALGQLEHLGSTWNFVSYPLLIATLFFIVARKGLLLYAYFSRAIVGGLFIVSGLIKANDPQGFAYKLEEYFEDGALAYRLKEWGWETFSLEVFMDYALPIAVIICVVEIVLGLAVIVGGKIKLTAWSLLLMTIFFGFLTAHTATCDPESSFTNKYYVEKEVDGGESCEYDNLVQRAESDSTLLIEDEGEEVLVTETSKVQCVNDCGCFGDALKGSVGRSLTPWESFAKDAVLLYFILVIFAQRGRIRFNTDNDDKVLMLSSIVVVFFFSWVFDGWYFPLTFSAIMFLLILGLKRMRELRIGHEWTIAAVAFVCSGAVTWYTLTYLPLKDYRAYSVGSNLIEKMNDGKPGEYKNIFVYEHKETGETIRMTQEELSTEWKRTSHAVYHFVNDSTGEKLALRLDYDGADSAKKALGDMFRVESKDDLWELASRDQETIKQPIPTSIQDFDPFKVFKNVTSIEMENDSILANIESQADMPRTEFIVLEVVGYGYNDTVPLADYQEFKQDYPDSMYKEVDRVEKGGIPVPDAQISFKSYLLSADQVLVFAMRKLMVDIDPAVSCRDDVEYELYASDAQLEELNALAEAAKSAGIPVYCLTSASDEQIGVFKGEVEPKYEFLRMDDTELKIVIRSNPGVLVLSNAVVKGKWSGSSIPDLEEVKETLKE